MLTWDNEHALCKAIRSLYKALLQQQYGVSRQAAAAVKCKPATLTECCVVGQTKAFIGNDAFDCTLAVAVQNGRIDIPLAHHRFLCTHRIAEQEVSL